MVVEPQREGELKPGLGAGPSNAAPAATSTTAPQTGQAAMRAFLDAPADMRTTSADRLEAPASPYVVQAGSVIPAALITGLRSDLPGQITAQVTENVYDSPPATPCSSRKAPVSSANTTARSASARNACSWPGRA